MASVAYIIEPLAPYHRSTGRERDLADVELLPRSDSLASAILSVWRHVSPATSQEELTALAASPPFALSSAMPCLELDGRWEPLLFVPPGLAERAGDANSEQRKQLKKVRFADAGALNSLLEGRLPGSRTIIGEGEAVLLSRPARENATLWKRDVIQRVGIDRATGRSAEGMLFRYGAVWFGEGLRLALLAEFFDPQVRPTFEAALRLLGSEGIGGGRTIGYGRFSLERVDDQFNANLGSGARLLLSLTHPTEEEIADGLLDQPARYALVGRGGAVEVNGMGVARRKSVKMLAEGSLVRDLSRPRYGQSVLVREADARVRYPVYRLGCAVSLPASCPRIHDG